jgi:hypothetical protein
MADMAELFGALLQGSDAHAMGVMHNANAQFRECGSMRHVTRAAAPPDRLTFRVRNGPMAAVDARIERTVTGGYQCLLACTFRQAMLLADGEVAGDGDEAPPGDQAVSLDQAAAEVLVPFLHPGDIMAMTAVCFSNVPSLEVPSYSLIFPSLHVAKCMWT